MKGIALTLDNGKTLLFEDKIKSYGPGGSLYENGVTGSILLPLTDDQLAMLKKQKITRIKLGTLERNFKDGAKLLEYIKCATN